MKFLRSLRKIPYLRLFIVTIVLTVAAGWILTDFLGRVAEKEFKEKADRDANLISYFLHDKLNEVTSAAKSLGPAEAIVAAFSTGSAKDMERANKLLDRIKNNFEMSVCYLLDKNGLTVASSNRNETNGFVGKSFANRPYFTGAVAGRLTTYFALGKITHERGYFTSVPVLDSAGATSGVVVVKRNITPVEEFFKKYPHVYLVSPDGIIFISSRKDFLFRSLWPIEKKIRSDLVASGQFGKISFDPLLAAKPRTGSYVRFENEGHYVLRRPFGSDGWTLVLLDDPRSVSDYRLFGIILAAVFGLLAMFFFTVLLFKNRSLETSRELFKAEENWGRIFDAVPEPIAIIDPEHRIINVNRAMAERLGISRERAIGRQCHELVHDCLEPHPSCPLRKLFDTGKTESGIYFEKNLDSDFIVTAAPIQSENGSIEAFVHIMHDVTEMKRLSHEVNRINNLESIGLLAGGLAHDFNNVLNIIYGNVTFVKMLAEGNAAFVEPLTDAEEACERAKQLGLRLQAFSQGGTPFREPIALPALIEDAAGVLFKGSHVSYSLSAADDLLPLEADPRQIRQLFENLLTNAKDAMPDGGTVKVDIENCEVDANNGLSLRSGPCVRITIQDDGSGIPETNLPKIFDPYFSTKDTYSQRGMGLGLSICHAIMKRHNGHISVESTVGTGARVALYLPASVEKAQVAPEG